MKICVRFTVAVHALLCINKFDGKCKVTSDFIAGSTNVNPVIIRKILGQLQKMDIVSTVAGSGGSHLKKAASDITLFDVYKAVNLDDDNRSVFNFHPNPNPLCCIGSQIHDVLDPCIESAEKAMENELAKVSIQDLADKLKDEQEQNI